MEIFMKKFLRGLIIISVTAALLTGCSKKTAVNDNKAVLTATPVPTQKPESTATPKPTATPAPTEKPVTTPVPTEKPVTTPAPTPTDNPDLSESVNFAARLKLGWNLGNTLDATGSGGMASETSWGQPKVTKELIDYVAECGFTSIRIPVSWGKHVDAEYNIDSEWMARVTEIVDYAMDAGLYVIINSHHDNDKYYPSEQNMDNAKKYLTAIWTQIADNFKDYDEQLIFEAMNEPRLANTDIEWWFQTGDERGCAAIERISELDQIFVDTVRAGENYNQTRYLGVPSYAASPDFTMHKSFTIPTDPAGRLMISIHAYTPYDFAMNPGGYDNWNAGRTSELAFIDMLNYYYVKNGFGVYIGEFGATNKNNLDARVAWAKDYTKKAASHGIGCFVWDNGGVSVGSENFGLINRKKLSLSFPELLDGYLSGYSN